MAERRSRRPTPTRDPASTAGARARRASRSCCGSRTCRVSFDGFKALNDLTLELDQGELRCLIGPNGAGKTTLMDVITGKTRPDTGAVFLDEPRRTT